MSLIERNIIGMMLFDNKVAEKCVEELKLSDFSNQECKDIFFIAQSLYSTNKPIDLVGVATTAEKMNIPGIDLGLIREIVSEVDTTAQVDIRIKEVKEHSFNKEIYEYAQKLELAALNNQTVKVSNILSNPPTMIETKEEKRTGELIQDSFNRMAERYKNPNATVSGNETGFRKLDEATGGIKNGELILIAAEPNVGKSILAHQIAINMAKQKKHAVCFNFEMNEEQLADRTMAIGLPFEIQKIKNPKQYLREGDIEKLKSHPTELLLDQYLHICTDKSNMTIRFIKSKCKKINATEGKIELVVVDYLQLMTGDGEDWEVSGKNCTALKKLADELKCPVIAIASLDKQGKTRGSGQIDFDADQKWFLTREHDARDAETRAKTELQIKKNRDGGKGVIDLIFQEQFIRFVGV